MICGWKKHRTQFSVCLVVWLHDQWATSILTFPCLCDFPGWISSVHSLDLLGHRGDMRDDSAEIFLQSFLQEALVSSSGRAGISTVWWCPSSTSSVDHDVAHTPKVPRRMVLERHPVWDMTCPNHASLCLWTIALGGSCRPTGELILLRTQSLVLCSKYDR